MISRNTQIQHDVKKQLETALAGIEIQKVIKLCDENNLQYEDKYCACCYTTFGLALTAKEEFLPIIEHMGAEGILPLTAKTSLNIEIPGQEGGSLIHYLVDQERWGLVSSQLDKQMGKSLIDLNEASGESISTIKILKLHNKHDLIAKINKSNELFKTTNPEYLAQKEQEDKLKKEKAEKAKIQAAANAELQKKSNRAT